MKQEKAAENRQSRSIGQRFQTKRKGRPLEPSTGDPDVDQRRARTRQATRAFRSRTANHFQELQRRVDTLQDVVEGLSETFVGVNDALVRSGYLLRDREIAKVLREGMERFLALSKVAQQEVDDGVEENRGQDVEKPLAGVLVSSMDSTSDGGSEIRHIPRQPISPQPLGRGEQSTSRNGSFSPRLSYGVFSGSSSQSSSPRATNNVIHYITAGHDSFAARLYWNSLTMAFRSLRGDEDFPIDFARSMFRYKMRYSTPQQVLTIIGHVLNQMLLGTSGITFAELRTWDASVDRRTLPDPSETGAVDTNAVKNAIHRDIIHDGGLVDEYLDTWAVERYLVDR